MASLIKFLESPSDKSIALSLFRVFICFHLFKKVLLFLSSGDILYGNLSFVSYTIHDRVFGISRLFLQENYKTILFIYITLIVLFLFGIGKYLTALFLYFMVRLIQELNGWILNGGDNLLGFIMLYLVFANSYDYFSIAPFSKKKTQIFLIRNVLTNLSLYSILLHLCLVYFVSAIGKINTSEWYKGVALYYTLLNDRFNGTQWNSVLAKNGFFVTVGTYFTLLFELLFPILIWQKFWRPLFIITGIGLHLSIYILMMIHDFELLFIAIYILWFNDSEFQYAQQKLIQCKIKIISFFLSAKSIF